MQSMYYIGLDVHKKTISYCVKDGSGRIHSQGAIPATRLDLDRWRKRLPQPWTTAMEATVFTGWIYDHLHPHAAALKVARKLVAYLMAVDCRQRQFLVAAQQTAWSRSPGSFHSRHVRGFTRETTGYLGCKWFWRVPCGSPPRD